MIEIIEIVETDDGWLSISMPKQRIEEKSMREQIVALMMGWA